MEAKDPKSVIREDFDRSGQYEAGLKSLVKSLQWAFAFLLVVIIAMLLYFFTGGGYFAVETTDRKNGTSNTMGAYRVTLRTDGHTLFDFAKDGFLFSNTQGILAENSSWITGNGNPFSNSAISF